MSEKYERGAADSLFDRVDKDKTGELKKIVMTLINNCKRASQLGIPMEEVATCCTMAWYMGKSPEIENMFKMMIKTDLNNKNNIN